MRQADRVGGAFLLFLAGFIIHQSLKLPMRDEYGPGSAVLPLWLGIILAGLSVLLLASTFTKVANDSNPFPDRATVKQLSVILGLAIVSSYLVKFIGMTIATTLFMGLILFYLEPKRTKLNIVMTAVTPFFVWFVFRVWLGLFLPMSPLGF